MRGESEARARFQHDVHDAQTQILCDLERLGVVRRIEVGEDLEIE